MTLLPGTYYDCVLGNHGERLVLKLALKNGWQDAQAQAAAEQEPENVEGWDDLITDAVDFLSTLTPQGYSFMQSENGDWGVYATEPVELTTKDLSGKVLKVEVLPKEEAMRKLTEMKLKWTKNLGTLTTTGNGASYEVQGLEEDELEPECTSK